MATKKPKKSVTWLVCDCGCRGFSFSLGTEQFWLKSDYASDNKGLKLFKGHGDKGENLGTFTDFKSAEDVVVDKLKSSGIIEKLERDLRKAKLLLK